MAEMKERDAYYCNLKLLLLYLVVFGHWIEPYLAYAPWAAAVYRVIYTVHMPLFVFVSGIFLSSGKSAPGRTVRLLFSYLAAQGIAMTAAGIAGTSLPFYRPYWHLWYLLSLSMWSAAVYVLERWLRLPARPLWVRLGAFLLSVGIGCGAGGMPWIGRDMSLSRTLVFFPYVLAARLCPRDFFRGRKALGAAALLGFAAVYVLFGSFINENVVTTEFLYQAEPYGEMGLPLGILLRLLCYLMGGLFGVGLMAFVPQRSFTFSRIGADTLGIYLCHAPMVLLFRLAPLTEREMLVLGPFAALWIICFLSRLFRWRGKLCRVYMRRIDRKGKDYDVQRDL